MVRLHALQSIAVHSAALEVNGTLFRSNGSLNRAARPESMAHPTPGVRVVGAESAGAGLAGLETGRRLCDFKVDNGTLVIQALDGIRVAVFRKLDGAIVGVKGALVFTNLKVFQRC